jgi:hypothetical protein
MIKKDEAAKKDYDQSPFSAFNPDEFHSGITRQPAQPTDSKATPAGSEKKATKKDYL